MNSLKARLPRVQGWIEENQPDVLCIQETKMTEAAFPALTFQEMGYETAHLGQGQWNGVAILSKVGLTDVVANFATGEPDAEARIISATCNGVKVVCVYVPNGRELENDHYKYKLAWMKRLIDHLNADTKSSDQVVVTGDYNIAPADIDVYNPADFVGATHVSEAERQVLRDLEAWGMVDVFRQQHPDDKLFSWWDYRAGGFNQNKGMRIDLIMATQSVADKSRWTIVDRQARKGEKPSDHAPVLVDIDV